MSGTASIEVLHEALDEHVEGLARLIPQLSSSALPDLEQLSRLLGQEGLTLLLARNGAGEIVGTLTLSCVVLLTAVRATIEDVVVDEHHRGAGIGAALVASAIEIARGRGASSVDLTSRPSRLQANKLYQRLGFERRETNVYRLALAKT